METYAPAAQEGALNTAQESRGADLTGNIKASDSSAIPLSGSAPSVVKGEIAKRMLTSFTDATARAKALGNLGGYGDNWLDNNVGVTDTSRRVGTLNNFSRGEAAILPGLQDAAQIRATQQPSIWGPILSAGGNVLAAGAGRGWSPFGASPSGVLPGGAPLGQGGIGRA
jgi:hypothetical protein